MLRVSSRELSPRLLPTTYGLLSLAYDYFDGRRAGLRAEIAILTDYGWEPMWRGRACYGTAVLKKMGEIAKTDHPDVYHYEWNGREVVAKRL